MLVMLLMLLMLLMLMMWSVLLLVGSQVALERSLLEKDEQRHARHGHHQAHDERHHELHVGARVRVAHAFHAPRRIVIVRLFTRINVVVHIGLDHHERIRRQLVQADVLLVARVDVKRAHVGGVLWREAASRVDDHEGDVHEPASRLSPPTSVQRRRQSADVELEARGEHGALLSRCATRPRRTRRRRDERAECRQLTR